jgi:thioredoxin-like negative regulator of GroEL
MSKPVAILTLLSMAVLSCLLCAPIQIYGAVPESSRIDVVDETAEKPDWKTKWDEARGYVESGEYEEAALLYEEITEQKPHSEELQWEYFNVLLISERFTEAELLIDTLLATHPMHPPYLIHGGTVALNNRNYSKALHYFSTLYEHDPLGEDSVAALHGMINALSGQGLEEITTPLWQQVYLRDDLDKETLLALARLYYRSGSIQGSARYFDELITKYRVSIEVCHEAALAFDDAGHHDLAAIQWQRYLNEHPSYHVFREKLVQYLLATKQYTEALPHLLLLIESEVNQPRYLLEAADIYLYRMGRIDKALNFYERYHIEHPDEREISALIGQLRLILADDLLAIIENDGAWKLWIDLSHVTPGRLGIYQAMAQLLEQLEKTEDLKEVLTIITMHKPDDFANREKLARMYLDEQSYSECQLLLGDAHEYENVPESVFLLKAQCDRMAGDEQSLIRSYSEYIGRSSPAALKYSVVYDTIRLAGDIGDAQHLQEITPLVNDYIEQHGEESDIIAEAYFQALLDNKLFKTAEVFLDTLPESFDDYFGAEGAELRIELYRQNGEDEKARLLLRRLQREDSASPVILFALIEQSLRDGDYFLAALSIDNLAAMLDDIADGEAKEKTLARLTRSKGLLLSGLGRYDKGIDLMLGYLEQNLSWQPVYAEQMDLALLVLRELLSTDDFARCGSVAAKFRGDLTKRPELHAIAAIARVFNENDQIERAQTILQDLLDRSPVSSAIAVCNELVALHYYDAAYSLLQKVALEYPESSRILNLLADSAQATARYLEALHHYRELSTLFPGEPYFAERVNEVESMLGEGVAVTFRSHPGDSLGKAARLH